MIKYKYNYNVGDIIECKNGIIGYIYRISDYLAFCYWIKWIGKTEYHYRQSDASLNQIVLKHHKAKK